MGDDYTSRKCCLDCGVFGVLAYNSETEVRRNVRNRIWALNEVDDCDDARAMHDKVKGVIAAELANCPSRCFAGKWTKVPGTTNMLDYLTGDREGCPFRRYEAGVLPTAALKLGEFEERHRKDEEARRLTNHSLKLAYWGIWVSVVLSLFALAWSMWTYYYPRGQ